MTSVSKLLSNTVEWNIQNGFQSKVEKDQALLAKENDTISKINTLRESWEATLSKISASTKTYRKTRPILENLQNEITVFRADVQKLVNDTYQLSKEKEKFKRRINEDPSKIHSTSILKEDHFKALLSDLRQMNISIKDIKADYNDFHKRTLNLNTSLSKVETALKLVTKVSKNTIDKQNYLRSVLDNNGKYQNSIGYYIYYYTGYYKYGPITPQIILIPKEDTDNPPQVPHPSMSMNIPPYKTKHVERVIIKNSSISIRNDLQRIKPKISTLGGDLRGIFDNTIIRRINQNSHEVVNTSYNTLYLRYEEYHKNYIKAVNTYHLITNKVQPPLKCTVNSDAARLLVNMGHFARVELESCYHEYLQRENLFNENLATIKADIKQIQPILETIRVNLKKLKEKEEKLKEEKLKEERLKEENKKREAIVESTQL